MGSLPQLSIFANGMGVVSDTTLNSYLQGCFNFNQLRTFTGLDTMTVSVLGQSVPADGFQGLFYWSSTATGADDNEDTIAPYGAIQGRWLRVPVPGTSVLPGRTPVDDTNYSMEGVDQWISYTALTAERTVTLLTTSTVGAGRIVAVGDESGSCSLAVPVQVITSGADKFNATDSTYLITSPYSYVEFRSNGNGLWIVHQ
jgi:hypothetical protein